ncbi:hypothetical protein BH09MYX1_BH09MYX1_23940 [soil metagenome]
MRSLAWIGLSALGTFALGALVYCSPQATDDGADAGVCDPDSGTNCPCDPSTYKPADCYSGPKGTNGKGICKAGKRTCVAGKLTACVGEVTPQVEVCDLGDNDCNGVTDDVPEFREAGAIAYCTSPACSPTFVDAAIECFSGASGICGAGRKTCAAGTSAGKPTGCQPFVKAGVAEECNGWDDDCNGSVDDGLEGQLGSCDADGAVGECAKSQYACADGGLACPPKDPSTEACNGKDDDCNGKIDDKSCPTVGADYCCKYNNSVGNGFCTSSSYYIDGGGTLSYTCFYGK